MNEKIARLLRKVDAAMRKLERPFDRAAEYAAHQRANHRERGRIADRWAALRPTVCP